MPSINPYRVQFGIPIIPAGSLSSPANATVRLPKGSIIFDVRYEDRDLHVFALVEDLDPTPIYEHRPLIVMQESHFLEGYTLGRYVGKAARDLDFPSTRQLQDIPNAWVFMTNPDFHIQPKNYSFVFELPASRPKPSKEACKICGKMMACGENPSCENYPHIHELFTQV